MAGVNSDAACAAEYWPTDLQLSGSAIDNVMSVRLTTGALARSITQASTIQMVFQDGDRAILSHEGADPFGGGGSNSPTYAYGNLTFALVQFAKKDDQVTLTAEDGVINKLRQYTGLKNQADGTRTRVDFAQQLCSEAGVPFIADTDAAPLNAPVSRGSTESPDEDSWSCLTRLAGDVGWRCFSDGTSVVFAPDSWLLSYGGGPAMTIAERTGGVDTIDGEMDTGKPVQSLSVTCRASAWSADPGGWVQVGSEMGPLAGNWIVSEINRGDLASDQLSVNLIAPSPAKPEPSATDSSGTSSGDAAATNSSGGSTGTDPSAGDFG